MKQLIIAVVAAAALLACGRDPHGQTGAERGESPPPDNVVGR